MQENRVVIHGTNTAKTPHKQKQDNDYEGQHNEQQPNPIERRAIGRDSLFHIPEQTQMEAQQKILNQGYRKQEKHSSC